MIYKMKRLLLGILLTVALPLYSFAQTLTSEDDIIDRQLSKQYFYGEGTETLDSTAKTKAIENLVANAQSSGVSIDPKDAEYYYYFSETGGKKYIHVYAFVKKTTFQTSVGDTQLVSHKDSEVDNHNNQSHQNCAHTTSPSLHKPNDNHEAEVTSSAKRESVPMNIEQTKWKLNVIESLLKCEDLSSLLEKVERMVVTKKIAEYGRYQDCHEKSTVCWVIFDSKNKIVTILGEGLTSRYNYKTKKPDDLDNYTIAPYKVLWFSFND